MAAAAAGCITVPPDSRHATTHPGWRAAFSELAGHASLGRLMLPPGRNPARTAAHSFRRMYGKQMQIAAARRRRRSTCFQSAGFVRVSGERRPRWALCWSVPHSVAGDGKVIAVESTRLFLLFVADIAGTNVWRSRKDNREAGGLPSDVIN